MNYITKEGEEAIRQFKYKGGDLSISYHYVWSPLAQKILLIIPADWAPNTITLIGFLTHVIGTLILASFTPFDTPAPPWALFLYGFSVFVYQTLDNVDGKQARKIHNSTPLGMIMDHGCDALGLLFLSVGLCRVLCYNNFEMLLTIFTIGVSFSFYISAWCQYYSDGVMILGKFNAVDDGIPAVWIIAMLTSVLGQEMWFTPVQIFGETWLLNDLFARSIIAMGMVQIYSIIHQAGNSFKNIGRALLDLLHLAAIIATVYLVITQTTLCHSHIQGLIVAVGFTMSRTISYTLLCSVSEMKFQQFQPSVLVLTITYSSYALWGQPYLNPFLVVYGVAAFAVIEYFVFVVSASQHIARILDIRILHVFTPKTEKKQD